MGTKEPGGCDRDIRRYVCKLCGIARSRRLLVLNHVALAHADALQKDHNDLIEIDKSVSSGYKDVRRYKCHICGISRSKRILLHNHVRTVHGAEKLRKSSRSPRSESSKSLHSCEQCGACFRKAAYLQEHMISHSEERIFCCPVDGCHKNYKWKKHLNRHLLYGHEGKKFLCPKEHCGIRLSSNFSLKRHLQYHEQKGDSWKGCIKRPRVPYFCPESGCMKEFKYPSKLVKHLKDVHSSTSDLEFICHESECCKSFPNFGELQTHIQQNHRHVNCEICGSQQLKKQIKRHMRIHEEPHVVERVQCPFHGCSHSYSNESNLRTHIRTAHEGGHLATERVQCPFKDCTHTYSNRSNLKMHIRAVHEGLRPFRCRIGFCKATFAHKHHRDSHENSKDHIDIDEDIEQDFEDEFDEEDSNCEDDFESEDSEDSDSVEDFSFQSIAGSGVKRKIICAYYGCRKRIYGPEILPNFMGSS